MNPWEEFDRAVEDVSNPVGRMREVLVETELLTSYSLAERVELRASATSVLAGHRDIPLSDAVVAVALAEQYGRFGWPNYYLAEAALSVGDAPLALDRIRSIPQGFFDLRDLHWRTVRCREIEAVALARAGVSAGLESSVRWLAAEYAGEADDEFLAPPIQLVESLLALGDTRLLKVFVGTQTIEHWMPGHVAAKVRNALRGSPD